MGSGSSKKRNHGESDEEYTEEEDEEEEDDDEVGIEIHHQKHTPRQPRQNQQNRQNRQNRQNGQHGQTQSREHGQHRQNQSREHGHHRQPMDVNDLNRFNIPINVTRVKTGTTLATNGKVLLFQNGSTTIDCRIAPNFEQKKQIKWEYGLTRDMIWCDQIGVFALLTKANLYAIDPAELFSASAKAVSTVDLTVNAYDSIKPRIDNKTFWRCACAGDTLFVIYAGYATIIDEYSFSETSSKFQRRWTPPETCDEYEGIRCIRYNPTTEELGFIIMDTTNNEWRFEARDTKTLTQLWSIELPFIDGDCEISALPNGDWLAVNSRGRNFVQISNQELKPLIEYHSDLKNATLMKNSFFAVRTRNTIELHRPK